MFDPRSAKTRRNLLKHLFGGEEKFYQEFLLLWDSALAAGSAMPYEAAIIAFRDKYKQVGNSWGLKQAHESIEEGGAGSGNFGHSGRPGERGGSGVGGGVEKPSEEIPWKPSMSPEEAKTWAKDSAVQETCYHCTYFESIASGISTEGFKVGDRDAYGRGVYLSLGVQEEGYGRVVVETQVNVKNPYDITDMYTMHKFESEVDAWVKTQPGAYSVYGIGSGRNRLTDYCVAKGYDALLLRNFGKMTSPGKYADWLVVFDPKKITVVGTKDLGAI